VRIQEGGGAVTEFDTAAYLRKATGRAKSDVANKLVSMLLHDISKQVTQISKQSVSDPLYAKAVTDAFGHGCLYCGRLLEHDRSAVEHLEGMNRFRLGLHIPGNVAVACVKCNREKRRDDQLQLLTLAKSGWESFLSHDMLRCPKNCKTCIYWTTLIADQEERQARLAAAMERIRAFRTPYTALLAGTERTRTLIKSKVETLYRECQEFAVSRIRELGGEVSAELEVLIKL
jgi:hypothetical protein